jgi:hypothetical protein
MDEDSVAAYRRKVVGAIRAVRIVSPARYSWFGERSPELPRHVRAALTPRSTRAYLLFALRQQLYDDFYCRGAATPAPFALGGSETRAMGPFAASLAAANAGRGTWEAGWEVSAVVDEQTGAVRVRRDGLELRARPQDCQVSGDAGLAPGVRVRLRMPQGMPATSPGFYLALGDEPLAIAQGETWVRLYWHLTAAGAAPFVARVTRALNAAGLPFRLKVVNDPSRFDRCDPAVLYLRTGDYAAAVEPLQELYAAVAATLRPGIPALTRPLAPGLGLAEDPGRGESFGQHRCGLLADGLIHARERGAGSVGERLRAVEQRFAAEGIGLEAPYLNRGPRDAYAFHPPPVARARGVGSAGRRVVAGAASYLEAAARIGERLAREATWWEDRCTWLGAAGEPSVDGRHGPSASYRTLGPDLYGGTGGVALFLAELSTATEDAATRRTAGGAMRQALARADDLESRLGLYAGRAGIGLAAAYVGGILDDDELIRGARELIWRTLVDRRDDPEFDLISGKAGAIVVLLALRKLLEDDSLLGEAARLGDELIRRAHVSEEGYSWSAPSIPARHDLTGMSHGSAGAAFALLELSAATGEARYRTVAERAFAYERNWFDGERENWPDFRRRPGERDRRGLPLRYGVAWCNGAPGIALTRLRAFALLGDEECRGEALAALRTTRAAVEEGLRSGIGNYSLCHGLAGNAAVLLYGAEVLGRDARDGRDLAHSVADAGLATYGSGAEPWPCGTPAGETPGLMLGLAGIGSFYLRLHDPARPNVLLPLSDHFEQWSRAAAGGREE